MSKRLTPEPTPGVGFARTLRIAFAAVGFGVFTILLLSLRNVDDVPISVTALLVVLAGFSAWNPAAALAILAASIPVASWVGRTWNGSVAWPETLAVAFAAGYSARALRRSSGDPLDPPVLVFIALVGASLAVRLTVLSSTIGAEAVTLLLVQLATADYFVGAGAFRELDAAMRMIEGMVLLHATASVSRHHPTAARRLVRCFVAGAAAAAVLNLWRVWQGALRADSPLLAFGHYLATLRYNVHFADVNAAGSYFVMALLPACALMLAGHRMRWGPAVALIASSAVLSGSRAALLGGAIAALAWAGWRLKGTLSASGMRSRALAVCTFVLLGGLIGTASYISARRNLTPSVTAIHIRAEFAKTTFRMVEAKPVFGVGIGRYPERSAIYSSPILVEDYGLRHENAHNNFLQVLGELGILGFAGLIWVLWAAARQALRAQPGRDGMLQQGIIAGLLAFVLTWLSGHPLLIDEPALLFWLLLGTASAAGMPARLVAERRASAGRSGRAVSALAIVVLAVSIPWRAQREVADADLEHRGIGLSAWQHAEDGIRYRFASASSTIFVPSYARVVIIPLRSTEPGVEQLVALRLDGQAAGAVRVPSDRWYDLQMVVPRDRKARFLRLELLVEGADASQPALLMVGRVDSR
jgi:hypothetical protein